MQNIHIWTPSYSFIHDFKLYTSTHNLYLKNLYAMRVIQFLILIGSSTTDQEDLKQSILWSAKCNISFPQDIVDLMHRFTENPDDIMLAEFDIISNHLDAAMDPKTENGYFPLHTHLVCIEFLDLIICLSI